MFLKPAWPEECSVPPPQLEQKQPQARKQSWGPAPLPLAVQRHCSSWSTCTHLSAPRTGALRFPGVLAPRPGSASSGRRLQHGAPPPSRLLPSFHVPVSAPLAQRCCRSLWSFLSSPQPRCQNPLTSLSSGSWGWGAPREKNPQRDCVFSLKFALRSFRTWWMRTLTSAELQRLFCLPRAGQRAVSVQFS